MEIIHIGSLGMALLGGMVLLDGVWDFRSPKQA